MEGSIEVFHMRFSIEVAATSGAGEKEQLLTVTVGQWDTAKASSIIAATPALGPATWAWPDHEG